MDTHIAHTAAASDIIHQATQGVLDISQRELEISWGALDLADCSRSRRGARNLVGVLDLAQRSRSRGCALVLVVDVWSSRGGEYNIVECSLMWCYRSHSHSSIRVTCRLRVASLQSGYWSVYHCLSGVTYPLNGVLCLENIVVCLIAELALLTL